MIKINLLPEEMRKSVEKKTFTVSGFDLGLVLSIVIVAISLALIFITSFYQTIKLNKKNQELVQLQKEKEELNVQVMLINELSKAKDELERRNQLINGLIKHKYSWAHILDEITSCMPISSMWLDKISDKPNPDIVSLEVSGLAFSNIDIANFISNLSKSSYISRVSVTNTKIEKFEDRDLTRFYINIDTKLEKPKAIVLADTTAKNQQAQQNQQPQDKAKLD